MNQYLEEGDNMQYMKPKNQMMGNKQQPRPSLKKKTPMKKKKKPVARRLIKKRMMPKY